MNEPKQAQVPELKFAHFAPDVWQALAGVERKGWVIRGVKNPETDQDHTVSLRRIAVSLLDELSDKEKEGLLDMLEVHEWPEVILGDQIVPYLKDDEVEYKRLKDKKFEDEKKALESMCERIGEKGQEILNLWLRYAKSSDEAASFARQLDKYQAVEQALEYERALGMPLFRDFIDREYSEKRITHPVLLRRMQMLEGEWESSNKQ